MTTILVISIQGQTEWRQSIGQSLLRGVKQREGEPQDLTYMEDYQAQERREHLG